MNAATPIKFRVVSMTETFVHQPLQEVRNLTTGEFSSKLSTLQRTVTDARSPHFGKEVVYETTNIRTIARIEDSNDLERIVPPVVKKQAAPIADKHTSASKTDKK